MDQIHTEKKNKNQGSHKLYPNSPEFGDRICVITNVTFLTLNKTWQTSHIAWKDAWLVQQLC